MNHFRSHDIRNSNCNRSKKIRAKEVKLKNIHNKKLNGAIYCLASSKTTNRYYDLSLSSKQQTQNNG